MSDPVENLNAYVMIHGGIDRHERLLDVDWVRDLRDAARAITNAFSDKDMDAAIDNLRKVVRSNGRGRTEV